jgi:hypothetical protein
MLGAIQLDWSPLANVAAVLGGLAILLGAAGIVNRVRARPFLALPASVGRIELAVFVLLPALLPLIFGGQWVSTVITAAANLALLGLIYGVVGYGLVAIVRWAIGRFLSQLMSSLTLLTRAVPLLMIFAIVLFLTTEVWQVFTDASGLMLALLGAIFVGLGTLFLAARLPREVRTLEGDARPAADLDRRQRLNVGLVLFISQALQVLFVSLAVGAFFVVFGLLAIDADVLRTWIGSSGHVLVSFDLGGDELELTEELLRVSGAIAAFTGLYFAIAMLTDSTYREEFLDGLTDEMREVFKARTEYLRLRPETAPG